MQLNKKLIGILTGLSLLAAACGSTAPGDGPIVAAPTDTPAPATNTPLPPTKPPEEAVQPAEEAQPKADTKAEEAAATIVEDTANPDEEPKLAKNGKPLLDDNPLFPYEPYWQTDFRLHTVPYSEIFSGGVPRDGIPPIDNPQFVSIDEADQWLEDQEPVFVVTVNEETRAYPLQIMTWHEIVNDEVGGVPVAVTFCPLCNSAITFDRRLDGTVYDFGVSGKLRNSDLIMWDRQTESWWQQLTGEAIAGKLVGEQLTFIPTQLVAWADFVETFPERQVLSRETGHSRPYGQNPYTGYDSDQSPFLFSGETDTRLAAVDRVVAVDLNGEFVAYPYKVLAEQNVAVDTVGGQEVVVFWQAGTTSALDAASIANSRDVGAAAVYNPIVNGQTLTFTWDGERFVDDQTGSRWNIFGQATEGELAGTQLEPVTHANHFWFAFSAFFPEARVYSGDSGQ